MYHINAVDMTKLHLEFTKSRACRSQDNALVEGKNSAVIRKLIGYILCAASPSVPEL